MEVEQDYDASAVSEHYESQPPSTSVSTPAAITEDDSEFATEDTASDAGSRFKSKLKTTVKRFAFLLGHTEIFEYFLNIKVARDEDFKAVLEEAYKVNKGKNNTKDDDGSRRRRRTEKEEDEELLHDETEVHEAPTTFTESPSYIQNGIMRDYQLQGLNWMISLYENEINGILADEMYQSRLFTTGQVNLHAGFQIFEFFCFRAKLIKDRLLPQDFEVCITSYEICLIEKAHFKKFEWRYIIIDEAHRIKNEKSRLSQIVRLVNSRNRMLITGTPLQNDLHELWALLNFLLPDVFSSAEDFDAWIHRQNDQDEVVRQLHMVLRPFLLRRIKSDVEKSLLPKKEINIYAGMSEMQRQWYRKILEKDIDAVNGVTGSKKEGKMRLLNIAMQLRKCCNHPYLFEGAEPGPPYTTDQHIVDNCGKMIILDKLLMRMKERGSRVLLFSQMSRVLDILEDYCWWKGYEYCRIDGQTSHEDRIASIDEYNKPDSTKFIFLLTTRAGGLGINLTTADIVILYDSDWNPQVDLQAQDRAHRIGQKKQHSFEERMIEQAMRKLRIDQLVVQQGRAAQQQKAASQKELLEMIQHGAEMIFNTDESNDHISDDIEEIMKQGEERTAELHGKFQSLGLQDLTNFTSEASAYEWQGEDFSNKRKAEIGFNWIQPAKRERKAGGYSIDNYYRDVLKGKPREAEPTAPRPPKQVKIYDFQFFPPRLAELQEKEIYYFRKSIGYKVPPNSIEIEEEDEEEREKVRLEEQARIDNAEPLTEEEIEEMKELETQGFSEWSKRDFQLFVSACARHGRKQYEGIASDLPDKSVADIKKYSKVFWDRYQEIEDWERIIAKIERGESERDKQNEVQSLLQNVVSAYRMPLQQLRIPYNPGARGKNYTEDEDRFLIVMLERHGYGVQDAYDRIREDIRRSPMFRFDWFLKSRTSAEIARRCRTLIDLLLKEQAEEEEQKPKARSGGGGSKKAAAKPSNGKRKR
ncbi:uncharacterized protein VTP21DRAFT_5519 [Calcarisporiella thermophila]|uniref:uncharacterized protein n=1 Tax=Calcarisporiella thermophila TaxID=911321 RepID=UPI0037431178